MGPLRQRGGGVDAVEASHLHVHENDVRVIGRDGVDDLVAVGGGGDEDDVGGALEHDAHEVEHHRVVIDREHADGLFGVRHGRSLRVGSVVSHRGRCQGNLAVAV